LTVTGRIDIWFSPACNSKFARNGRNGYGEGPPLDTQNPDYSIPVTAPSLIITDRVETIGQVGLYAQNQSKIADHWVLSVGGRQAWIDHTNFDRLGDAGSYDQKDHASPAMSASAISSTMA
jgi:iron complex outermembrane receptor protein